MPIKTFSLTAALVMAALALSATAEAVDARSNWPQWRGPLSNGTSAATNLPTNWSATENIEWRLELPGPAASTPIVWGDRIFLTSTKKGSRDLLVLAVSRSGEKLWERSLDQGVVEVFEQFRNETSAATPSPVTDGTHVWALFGTGKLVCVDFDGNLVWQTDLAQRYGRPNMYFGLSMSPLLHGNHLYLQLLHSDAQLVVALDKGSGKEVWRQERPTDASGECLHSYASPIPFRDQILIHGSDHITAHSMADGSEIWRFGTYNPPENYNPMFRMVATPVTSGDLVVVPTAKRGPVFGLRPGAARGTLVTGTGSVAWTLEQGTPDVPSPLVHDDLLYLSGERGTLTVLEVDTGAKIYEERVHQSAHRASPVLADGKLFLTGTDGTVSVVLPGREFSLLAKNPLNEYVAASPAISDGVIYLRSYEALYAIGPRGATPPH